jgi:tRNA threonylcarbamoyladenosine biosynthesis protein TsaB
VIAVASGGLAVVCEVKVAERLVELRPRFVEEPLAGDALPFAVERVMSGEFDDAATLDANYLRSTDAEIFAKPVVSRTVR